MLFSRRVGKQLIRAPLLNKSDNMRRCQSDCQRIDKSLRRSVDAANPDSRSGRETRKLSIKPQHHSQIRRSTYQIDRSFGRSIRELVNQSVVIETRPINLSIDSCFE